MGAKNIDSLQTGAGGMSNNSRSCERQSGGGNSETWRADNELCGNLVGSRFVDVSPSATTSCLSSPIRYRRLDSREFLTLCFR